MSPQFSISQGLTSNAQTSVRSRSIQTGFASSRRPAIAAVGCLLIAAGAALGESDYSNTPPGPFPQPTPTYPVEMGLTQHHSSTAAEGAQRGAAARLQAESNYLLSESQSEILLEQARWLRSHNDVEQTHNLYVQQNMWQEHRAEQKKQQEAAAIAGRDKLAERRTTAYLAAYRLGPDQFDAVSGAVIWPETLRAEKYAPLRDRVDQLFREHLHYGDPQPATAAQIKRCLEQLKHSLEHDIKTMPRDEYFAAQKFIVGLEYAAEFPTPLG